MGLPPDRVAAWYRRNWIKAEYWSPLILAAKELGVTITEAELLEAANEARGTEPAIGVRTTRRIHAWP